MVFGLSNRDCAQRQLTLCLEFDGVVWLDAHTLLQTLCGTTDGEEGQRTAQEGKS